MMAQRWGLEGGNEKEKSRNDKEGSRKGQEEETLLFTSY